MTISAKITVRRVLGKVLSPYLAVARLLLESTMKEILKSNVREISYEGIALVGDDQSINYFIEALNALAANDPSGMSLVRRHLKRIVCSRMRLKRGFIVATLFCTPQTVHDIEVGRFSSLIVRYAVLSRLLIGYRMAAVVFYYRRCMKAALIREYRSMKRMNCSPDHIREQEAFLKEVRS